MAFVTYGGDDVSEQLGRWWLCTMVEMAFLTYGGDRVSNLWWRWRFLPMVEIARF